MSGLGRECRGFLGRFLSRRPWRSVVTMLLVQQTLLGRLPLYLATCERRSPGVPRDFSFRANGFFQFLLATRFFAAMSFSSKYCSAPAGLPDIHHKPRTAVG